MSLPSPPADLVPLIGGGLVAYALVLVAAIALCSAARDRDAADRDDAGDPLPALPAAGVVGARSPEALVTHVALLLGADAALFGWDLRADGLRLVAASRPALASGDAGRHLAREAVMAGSPARPPALEPAALAVPAERHDVRLGALCVSRPGQRAFTARERTLLLRLGALAADVLREHPHVAATVREVPA
jgi:hypothetical protein